MRRWILPAVALVACTSRSGVAPSAPQQPTVTTISIYPVRDSIGVGSTLQYVDTARDQNGNVLSDVTVVWASANPKVATISTLGLALGAGVGHDTIEATSGGVAARAPLTVGPGSVARIQIAPNPVTLQNGQGIQLVATALDSRGDTVAASYQWTSSNGKIAFVSSTGFVTATGVGTDTIAAVSGSITASAVLTVQQAAAASIIIAPVLDTLVAGSTVSLTDTVKDAKGNVLSGLSVSWTSGNTSVATISSTGQVQAALTGTAVMTASVSGISAHATIVVKPGALARVLVSPNPITLQNGQTVQLSATGLDAHGDTVPGASQWSVSNSQVASVSSTGLLTATAAGTDTVRASRGSVVGAAPVTVQQLAAASIVVVPAADTLFVGQLLQLSDTVKDARGNVLTGLSVSWSSSSSSVATVSANGVVAGIAPGSAVITASIGSITARSTTLVVGNDSTGIQYHGGPIMYSPRIAAIYWSPTPIYPGGPGPGTSGSPAGADGSLLAYFLQNLGGSPLFNILTTYYDASDTFIQNVVTYSQYWSDSTSPPQTTGTFDVLAEVERGFANGSLTYDPSTLYTVFTGPGVNLGGGFGTQYCGWHTEFGDSLGRIVRVAAMPFDADPAQTYHCNFFYGGPSPNNDPADAEVNVLTHELAEAATDEDIDAWFTVQGGMLEEIGDLCAWQFGSLAPAGNGAVYNQVIGGKQFLVQMLWVNESQSGGPVGCQQAWSGSVASRARSRTLTRAIAVPRLPGGRRAPHIMPPLQAPQTAPTAAARPSSSRVPNTARSSIRVPQ